MYILDCHVASLLAMTLKKKNELLLAMTEKDGLPRFFMEKNLKIFSIVKAAKILYIIYG